MVKIVIFHHFSSILGGSGQNLVGSGQVLTPKVVMISLLAEASLQEGARGVPGGPGGSILDPRGVDFLTPGVDFYDFGVDDFYGIFVIFYIYYVNFHHFSDLPEFLRKMIDFSVPGRFSKPWELCLGWGRFFRWAK